MLFVCENEFMLEWLDILGFRIEFGEKDILLLRVFKKLCGWILEICWFGFMCNVGFKVSI